MTPTTREPSLTAAPCTLLLSSRPVRETRSVAWTTAAATAAHAAALALLLWATARMPPLAPIDGTDTIVLELPEPGLSMPRMPGPAAPAPGHADSPRRPAPAARPA
ncbi:MAG: hypothetical protein IRZ00_08905, partial [Gemmatimonadetes bacterium]|nr:hypothetical protein [Gemmatimonadota bacterium]